MAITVHDFFRFGSDYSALLSAIFDRDAPVDRVELRSLIQRYVDEDAPTYETIETQLLEFGFLDRTPESDSVYELRTEIRDLLAYLLKRQEIATAEVIRGYLAELATLTNEIRTAFESDEFGDVLPALRDLDRTLEKIRSHARGNFETITSRVQEIQADRKQLSARQKFEQINRLWHRALVPLRDLMDDRGQIEQRAEHINRVLADIEKDDVVVPAGVRRSASSTRSRLARARRALSERHDAAVREVKPLYEQLRADSMMLEGASRMLDTVRRHGAPSIDLDARMALEGWRPRGLFSDDHLAARFAALRDYAPPAKVELSSPPPPVDFDPLRRDEVRERLERACPVDDVLSWVIDAWPDRSPSEILKIYGWIHRGDFGQVGPLADLDERVYRVGGIEMYAWPLAMERLTP